MSHSLVAVGHVRQQKLAVLGRVGGLLVSATAHRSHNLPAGLLEHALREDAEPCWRPPTTARARARQFTFTRGPGAAYRTCSASLRQRRAEFLTCCLHGEHCETTA